MLILPWILTLFKKYFLKTSFSVLYLKFRKNCGNSTTWSLRTLVSLNGLSLSMQERLKTKLYYFIQKIVSHMSVNWPLTCTIEKAQFWPCCFYPINMAIIFCIQTHLNIVSYTIPRSIYIRYILYVKLILYARIDINKILRN